MLLTLTMGLAFMAALLMSAAPMTAMAMDAESGASVVAALAADTPTVPPPCATTCVDSTADVCRLAAGVTGSTLMALFLTTRRNTFLGLLARRRRPLRDDRPAWTSPPWTVLSLSDLGVSRV